MQVGSIIKHSKLGFGEIVNQYDDNTFSAKFVSMAGMKYHVFRNGVFHLDNERVVVYPELKAKNTIMEMLSQCYKVMPFKEYAVENWLVNDKSPEYLEVRLSLLNNINGIVEEIRATYC